MFFAVGALSGLASAAIVTMAIMLGIFMTLAASRVLSATLLKGEASSFTLELPPYRRPQFLKVIYRSLVDRTIFVLGRAVMISAPAGILIWLMANISVDGSTLLSITAGFLDPAARLIGLDGVILLAFILGFPANEIVFPIIIMAYLAQGTMAELPELSTLRGLLEANGWTWLTALNTMIFCLMHFPCSTTVLTIYKETKSAKWTLVSILTPLVSGTALCALTAFAARLFDQSL